MYDYEDDLRKFASIAEYKSLEDEGKNMFRAAALHVITSALKVIPTITAAEALGIPEKIIVCAINYGRLWVEFIHTRRDAINCLDIGDEYYPRYKTLEEFTDGMCTLYVADKTFAEGGSEHMKLRSDVLADIEAGKRKKCTFSNMRSVGDLFLMLNFKLTVAIVGITHHDAYIELIDRKLSERYKIINSLRREAIRNDVIEQLEEGKSESDSSTEELVINGDIGTIAPAAEEPVAAAETSVVAAEEPMPELIPIEIASKMVPDVLAHLAASRPVLPKMSKGARKRVNAKRKADAKLLEEKIKSRIQAKEDASFARMGDFICALCAGIYNLREKKYDDDGKELPIMSKPYPEWLSDTAEEYLQFCLDSVIHIVILFINENQEFMFADKIEKMKEDFKNAKTFKTELGTTVYDCMFAIMELFDSGYAAWSEVLDYERAQKMKKLSREFITENKKLLSGMMKGLHEKIID